MAQVILGMDRFTQDIFKESMLALELVVAQVTFGVHRLHSMYGYKEPLNTYMQVVFFFFLYWKTF